MLKAAIVAIMSAAAPRLAVAQTPPSTTSSPAADRFAAVIEEAAQRFAVPPLWLRLVMRAESGGDPAARSPKGAIGLMQIMPTTFARLSQAYGLGPDPYQPRDNILAGAAYLREMYDRYGSPGFLAAYNAGPARYETHLAKGQPLPAETQTYLARLAPLVAGVQAGRRPAAPDPLAWTHAPLFTVRATTPDPVGQPAAVDRPTTPLRVDVMTLEPRSNGLFVSRPMTGTTP